MLWHSPSLVAPGSLAAASTFTLPLTVALIPPLSAGPSHLSGFSPIAVFSSDISSKEDNEECEVSEGRKHVIFSHLLPSPPRIANSRNLETHMLYFMVPVILHNQQPLNNEFM